MYQPTLADIKNQVSSANPFVFQCPRGSGKQFAAMNTDQVRAILLKNTNFSAFDEVIINDIAKVYFDVDLKTKSTEIVPFERKQRLLLVICQAIYDHFSARNMLRPRILDWAAALECFDVFDNSRVATKYKRDPNTGQMSISCQYYKLSWHLVLFPARFHCIPSQMAQTVRVLDNELTATIMAQFGDIIDESVSGVLDVAPYRRNGGLRFANCIKKDETVQKQYLNGSLSDVDPLRMLIQYVPENSTQLVIHYEQQEMEALKEQFRLGVDVEDLPSNAVELVRTVIDTKLQQHGFTPINGRVKHISNGCIAVPCKIRGNMCPVCKRSHDSENGTIIYTGQPYVQFMCFRNQTTKIYYDLEGNAIERPIHRQKEPPKDVQLEVYEFDHYVHLNQDNLKYPDTDSFGVDSQNCALPDMYIRSPMGTGKTKALCLFLKEQLTANNHLKVCILSHRISLSSQTLNKINTELADLCLKFVAYNQIHTSDVAKQQLLVIQTESLNKLDSHTCTFDLVIMDESESIMGQLISGLSSNETFNIHIFNTMVSCSERVICQDAHLGDTTCNIITKLRPNRPKVLVQNEYIRLQKNFKLFVDEVITGNKYNETLQYTKWVQTIELAIQDGKRVVIPCNSKAKVNDLQVYLKDMFPNKVILIYTADLMTTSVKQSLGNVNNVWKNCDILIYSPAIGAGVSFEEHHFDQLFGYYDSNVTDLKSFVQMIGRVRNLADNISNIYISKEKYTNLPTTNTKIVQYLRKMVKYGFLAELPEGLTVKEDKNGKLDLKENSLQMQLHIHKIRETNTSIVHPVEEFQLIMKEHNITMSSLIDSEKSALKSQNVSMKEQSRANRETEWENVVAAPRVPNLKNIKNDENSKFIRMRHNFEIELQILNTEIDILPQIERNDIDSWKMTMKYRQVFSTHQTYKEFTEGVNNLLNFDNKLSIQTNTDYSVFRKFEIIQTLLGFNKNPFEAVVQEPDYEFVAKLHSRIKELKLIDIIVKNINYLAKPQIIGKKALANYNKPTHQDLKSLIAGCCFEYVQRISFLNFDDMGDTWCLSIRAPFNHIIPNIQEKIVNKFTIDPSHLKTAELLSLLGCGC